MASTIDATAGQVAEDEAGENAAGRLVAVAAGLSIAASMIHASVTVPHFREYWLFGVFFVLAALFQLIWGLAAWTRRDDRRLLAVGAVVNVAIVLLWLATRTVGLPIGPEPGEVEPARLHDLLATADELAVALACGLVLIAGERGAVRLAWLAIPLWILAAASAVLAFPAPHSV